MANRRAIDPQVPARRKAARSKARPARARRHLERPNGWFAFLHDFVAQDLRERRDPPPLDEDEILAWADAHHERTGRWPTWRSGLIPESPGETWMAVEAAMALGGRGLEPGGTLPRFFAEHRGRYNPRSARFTVAQILAWADQWRERTGEWPTSDSGDIPGIEGLNWAIVDNALRRGRGGLVRGSSLSRLLTAERGVLPVITRLTLNEEQVLAWADDWHERSGRWPTQTSGEIPGLGGINWSAVDNARREGRCGLPGGSSLSRLLSARRGVFHHLAQPRLTLRRILAWADEYRRRTGSWPQPEMGPIGEFAPGETWKRVDAALNHGSRGLPGGSSLPHLLVTRRGVRSKGHLKPLSEKKILAWADAYHARHGRWPTAQSGPIPEAPGETWLGVQSALRTGLRGLPGGSSLANLLVERRHVRNRNSPPPLTITQILAWADAHHERTGRWPTITSGPVVGASGETWQAVRLALYHGLRGLPGGSSLARLLAKERGVRNEKALPLLRVGDILSWADAYHVRHGAWPTSQSGPIAEAPGETWSRVHHALYQGGRGLRGGSSLARLLAERRGVRNIHDLPPINVGRILAWADAHFGRQGRWPNCRSGPILEAPERIGRGSRTPSSRAYGASLAAHHWPGSSPGNEG